MKLFGLTHLRRHHARMATTISTPYSIKYFFVGIHQSSSLQNPNMHKKHEKQSSKSDCVELRRGHVFMLRHSKFV